MDIRTSSSIWLLIFTMQCATALICYQCESNSTHSDCENKVDNLKDYAVRCNTSYCALEIKEYRGQTVLFRRHCSNGTMTIINNAKMKHLNAESNITVYSVERERVIAASLCADNYCNGPINSSPTPHFQFSFIALSPFYFIFLSPASFNTLSNHYN